MTVDRDNDMPQDSNAPDAANGASRGSSWVDTVKWCVLAAWGFTRRQKVPAFLKFYGEHWRDVLTYIGDGYSSPSDSELWIRESDPSPGLYREGAAWDIDAASCCVICGAGRETERRRVRSVVYDFDGMIYGVLAALLGAVVVWFATDSVLIAIGVFILGLWGARRLVVEEQVRMHCSVCPKHVGEEQSLYLRLKRETLIIELGSRKARLAFLRKSRESSGQNPWETPPPPDDVSVPPATPKPSAAPVATMPLASLSESDEDDQSEMSASGDARPDSSVPLPRIPLADLDDSEAPTGIHAFELHSSDGQSVDGPIVSDSAAEAFPVDHYFQPIESDDDDQEGGDFEFQPAPVDNVVVPSSDGGSETIPLSGPVPPEAQTDGGWICRIDGVEIGPVPLEQALQLKAAGTLKASDAVRRAEERGWSGPEALPGNLPKPNRTTSPGKSTESDKGPWKEANDDPDELWDPWAT